MPARKETVVPYTSQVEKCTRRFRSIEQRSTILRGLVKLLSITWSGTVLYSDGLHSATSETTTSLLRRYSSTAFAESMSTFAYVNLGWERNEEIFAGFRSTPVMRQSVSARMRSHRCEPIKPPQPRMHSVVGAVLMVHKRVRCFLYCTLKVPVTSNSWSLV